jgi:transposase InsO family protein
LKEFEMYADANDGYCQLLTVIDHFSNFGFAYPLRSKRADEVAGHLYSLFNVFGPPQLLHSDNGGEFVNHIIDALLTNYGIEVCYSILLLTIRLAMGKHITQENKEK